MKKGSSEGTLEDIPGETAAREILEGFQHLRSVSSGLSVISGVLRKFMLSPERFRWSKGRFHRDSRGLWAFQGFLENLWRYQKIPRGL